MEKSYKKYLRQINTSDEITKSIDCVYDALIACQYQQRSQFSHFLDPETRLLAQKIFAKTDLKIISFGGYQNAEYQMLGFFPCKEKEELDEFPIKLLEISYNQQYGTLSHRDVLGALMSLGIERWTIGDIIISDEKAFVFAQRHISDYICQHLQKVKRLGVSVHQINIADFKPDDGTFETVYATVSSLRIDAVIASVYHLSRSKAQSLIKYGQVKCNYQVCVKVDNVLKSTDLISVRKYGRFYLDEILGISKKGKQRIVGRKPKG